MNIPWVEKYRPSRTNEVVLDPLNRELFQNILDKNYFPNLLIYGPPGSGKTTIIQNIINDHQTKYDRINKSNVIHLNASDERGIDIIRNQIHQFVKSKNLFESGLKFVILDEVDYMTKNAQQALKYILQTSTYNVRFCLMCNYITKIDESLKNEFLCIRFNQLPRKDILHLMKHIASNENLQLSNEIIFTIQKIFLSDIRSMINYIQLNQNTINIANCVMNNEVLINIHNFIRDKLFHPESAASDVSTIHYIHEVSIQYNLDKRTIIQKYLNFLICDFPEISTPQFLSDIEIILHRHDIPIEVHINYLLYLLSKSIWKISEHVLTWVALTCSAKIKQTENMPNEIPQAKTYSGV